METLNSKFVKKLLAKKRHVHSDLVSLLFLNNLSMHENFISPEELCIKRADLDNTYLQSGNFACIFENCFQKITILHGISAQICIEWHMQLPFNKRENIISSGGLEPTFRLTAYT